jgi:hypothetical protein
MSVVIHPFLITARLPRAVVVISATGATTDACHRLSSSLSPQDQAELQTGSPAGVRSSITARDAGRLSTSARPHLGRIEASAFRQPP